MKSLLIRDLPPRATALVVALVLAASVVTGRERPSDAPPRPAERLAAQIRAEAPGEELGLERLERTHGAGAQADPFAPRSFASAAGEAPAAAAAPARPSAPPLPFTYLGKVIEDGRLSVFLSRGGQNYSVGAPQQLDREYRVDKVTETRITFTYLPLGSRQSLEIPAAN
jgi:hypothetical protein